MVDGRLCFTRALHQLGKHVRAAMVDASKPVVVIGADPGALELFGGQLQQIRGRADATLDAVAQPVRRDAGILVQRPHDGRHRIGVIEKNHGWTAFLHASADIDVGGDGTQGHHHTGGTGGVAYRQMDSELGADVHVGAVVIRTMHPTNHLGTAAPYGRKRVVRPVDRFVGVGRGAYVQARTGGFTQPPSEVRHALRFLGVDVVEHDIRTCQFPFQSQVSEDAAEVEATAAEAHDLDCRHS